jgi:hypothetical protein
MKESSMFKKFLSVAALVSMTFLSACGGGSDTSSSTPVGAAAFAGRYTGTVAGISNSADSGTFDITADSNGKVAGTTMVKNLPWTLAGSVDANGILKMNLFGGSVAYHNWSGSINKTTGAVNGTWEHSNGDGVNGTFAGSKR